LSRNGGSAAGKTGGSCAAPQSPVTNIPPRVKCTTTFTVRSLPNISWFTQNQINRARAPARAPAL
jgi:hypothetical protein